jgi:hypothetical protein
MIWLKQSTAATLVLGPFVDSTDGFTAETALTISQADVRLSKNGAAFAQKNDATAATHMENGYYSVPLNTTDTNTLGVLDVAVNEAGALPVFLKLMVVSAQVYESLIASTEFLEVCALAQEFTTSGGTITYKKRDNSTTQGTTSATTTGGANPVTGLDRP